jgi:hypothetical protein
VSRFCVFWIRNTMRKVTMVVPSIDDERQVSLKPNIGPVTSQARIVPSASPKDTGRPESCAVFLAKRVNHDAFCLPFMIATPRAASGLP